MWKNSETPKLKNKKTNIDVIKARTEKSMFFLSWLTALGSGTASLCLITLTDSPEKQKTDSFESKLTVKLQTRQRTQIRQFERFQKLTSKDGLVNTQGGGLDGNNPDVSGDFVTDCGSQRETTIKMNPCYYYF